MIYGYKCFKKDLVNNYGVKFQEGKTYHAEGEIIFGIEGNGFHMCERLEDTLRFFDTFKESIDICKVIGHGRMIKRDDEYNGYYDMYACEYIDIVKKMTREEIIFYGLNLIDIRLIRFISLYKLTDFEKELFKEKFKNNELIYQYINYYQENKKDAFVRKLELR